MPGCRAYKRSFAAAERGHDGGIVMFGFIATLRVGVFGCIARITLAVAALAFATQASATFHTYEIEQLYSNADGTVQFIVLHEAARADGQEFFAGHQLHSTSNAGTKTYTFPRWSAPTAACSRLRSQAWSKSRSPPRSGSSSSSLRTARRTVGTGCARSLTRPIAWASAATSTKI